MEVRGIVLIAVLGSGALWLGSASASGLNCVAPAGRVSQMICSSPELRRLDSQLGALYEQVENETRGVDGETGKVVDPFGEEQELWRVQTRDRCATSSCLKKAYGARIDYVRHHWHDAL